MNVFEDLIGELKDENLLEDTVLEVRKVPVDGFVSESVSEPSEFDTVEFESDSAVPVADAPEFTKHANDREFFQKRAMDEVSSLQMVEHVFAGVEREHMKMPAAPYDDLEVKKALHKFMQVSNLADPEAHAEAEFQLMEETQGWHSALSVRDKAVSVANMRRFCENSRPVLSSQALMALARFYRNSPFTEDVRSKFDFVMTRLFARDAGLERRKMLFGRDETIGHIRTLYANWSSITYHASEEHAETIELSVQRFDDLVRHFEVAPTFDDLLNANVFNTIRQYKEECGELFFAPEIMAAAIECNVRLGNKYVFLIVQEKNERGPDVISEKYGFSYDQIASNATGKTLLLQELLRGRAEDADFSPEKALAFEQESFDVSRSVAIPKSDAKKEKRSAITGVNKWLVAATVLVALVSGGVYLWADKFAGSSTAVSVANEVDLEGNELRAHLKTMRLSNGTAYGVTQPSWDALSENDQKEFLKKTLAFAQTKGMVKVNLLNYKGRTVAFASKDRLDIFPPN